MNVKKLNFGNYIMNASGALCRKRKELNDLEKSKSSCIVSKTCSFTPRKGNEKPRYFATDTLSINSMGLPNQGYRFYLSQQFKKPYIISVSPLDLKKFQIILDKCYASPNIDGIEINLSCPNIIGQSQIGYDLTCVKEIVSYVRNEKPTGLKLPPYFDFYYFDQISKIIETSSVSFLTCINSIGNGLVINIETETSVIKPKGGLGGIGGSVIKPIALANVYQFHKRLPNIDIIGCGGITNGEDIFEHILAGASAVQIGTCLVEEGTDCFERLEIELEKIMKEKKYKSIKEFQGKLKNI